VLPIIETNEKKDKIIVNKAVVINEEYKGKLQLSTEQVEDYNITSNRMRNVRFELRVNSDQSDFTVYVDTVKTKYKIITSNNKPVINMNIDMKGVVEESKHRMSQQNIETYNKLANEVVKKRIDKFLAFLQKNEVDPIGFGLRYEATHWHHKDLAAEWKKIYPEITFDVSVNMSIKSLGSIE